VALLSHLTKKKAFGHREINQVVTELNLKFSVSAISMLVDELIADGVIQKSGDVFEFRHLSLQEYLAALEMFSDPAKEIANGCLGVYLEGDQWWRDVMEFYVLLIRDPGSAVRWIEQQMKARRLTNNVCAKNRDHLSAVVRKGFASL
jgi:hypothetical protein